MALEDFLGETSEIKIIDFLAENMDNSYNQTEISEFTGLSRTTVNKKIIELIQNNILEIHEELGRLKTYRLADNEIIRKLIAASLAHSFKQAENPLEEEEVRKEIRRRGGLVLTSEENRFHIEPAAGYIIMTTDRGRLMRSRKMTLTSAVLSA